MSEFKKEKIPSIEIRYVETEPAKKEASTDNIKKVKEPIKQEEKKITLEGWKLYSLVIIVLIVLYTVSDNAYTAHNEVRKVNTQLTKEKASIGAKIGALISKRDDNRKQWSEEQKVIDSAMKKQDTLNIDTQKIETELEKLNISLIK